VILSEKRSIRHIAVAIVSIGAAWSAGYVINDIGGMPASIEIVVAIAISLAVVLKLKNTSTGEIRYMIQAIAMRKNTVSS
jgi:hypothetical protein